MAPGGPSRGLRLLPLAEGGHRGPGQAIPGGGPAAAARRPAPLASGILSRHSDTILTGHRDRSRLDHRCAAVNLAGQEAEQRRWPAPPGVPWPVARRAAPSRGAAEMAGRRRAADRRRAGSLPGPAAGPDAGLAAARRPRDHRHRGRGRRVRPAPALRRGRPPAQRERPGRLAGRDSPARAGHQRAQRLGQPAAPGRRGRPAARRGPAQRHPAGRGARGQPGGRHGGLPGRPAGGPGPAFRRGRLAAVPGGRLRAAVGAADRAVLGRPGRFRRRRAS